MREYVEYITRYERGEDGTLIQRIGYGYEPIAERIVRCRDCKHYGCYDGSTWCRRTYEQVPSGTCDYQTVEPDGFCKWGKPK